MILLVYVLLHENIYLIFFWNDEELFDRLISIIFIIWMMRVELPLLFITSSLWFNRIHHSAPILRRNIILAFPYYIAHSSYQIVYSQYYIAHSLYHTALSLYYITPSSNYICYTHTCYTRILLLWHDPQKPSINAYKMRHVKIFCCNLDTFPLCFVAQKILI